MKTLIMMKARNATIAKALAAINQRHSSRLTFAPNAMEGARSQQLFTRLIVCLVARLKHGLFSALAALELEGGQMKRLLDCKSVGMTFRQNARN